MALQKIVGALAALGIAGQEVVPGQAKYLHYNPLSDGTVKAGTFAFKGSATGDGEEFGFASAKGADGEVPLGFVERVVGENLMQVTDTATVTYQKGNAVTVAVGGQFYATAAAAVTDGQKVLIKPADGTIAYGASAGTGQVDTGWVVRLPQGGASAAKDEIVIYERI